ncbi:oligosaccharide repeat unit polymerase [Citrobacter werkmanii]|uniref:oligosaccharide repeat unit polymerase n=1 Tax=Citrobacter werkmanii TaxID=67827 RepID=UPI0009A2217A|nr:oligosaccharide repeat unit polymerase [Citrobacter werkmanii]
MKYISFTPKVFIMLVSSFYFIVNTILYIMRMISDNWWVGDYAVYDGVSSNINTEAYLFFLVYFSSFFTICGLLYKKISVPAVRMDLKFNFYFISILFIFQIYAAVVYEAGKASSTGETSNTLLYLLFLFSFDAFYYIYAVLEKNKKRLFIASFLFVISNISRGWAGFVIPLFLIYLLRKKRIKLSNIIVLIIIAIMIVPILLTLRDYYRGGSGGNVSELYNDEGFNFFNYILISLKLIISRFDLYSHYIGVQWIQTPRVLSEICMPYQENIFNKLLLLALPLEKCVPLGSYLPSSLYPFFLGKGTSFSIGSAFFALPFYYIVAYAICYIIVIFMAFLISRPFIRNDDMTVILLFLFSFLLFQGWMYQFIYNYFGFLLCSFLSFTTIRKHE